MPHKLDQFSISELYYPGFGYITGLEALRVQPLKGPPGGNMFQCPEKFGRFDLRHGSTVTAIDSQRMAISRKFTALRRTVGDDLEYIIKWGQTPDGVLVVQTKGE